MNNNYEHYKKIDIVLPRIKIPAWKNSNEIASILRDEISRRILNNELLLIEIEDNYLFNLYDSKRGVFCCRVYKINNKYYCPDNCVANYLENIYTKAEDRYKLYEGG